MGKRQAHFERIADFKSRMRELPTAALRARLGTGALTKEAAVAIREVLAEREPEGTDVTGDAG
jgi:hypothetical protein